MTTVLLAGGGTGGHLMPALNIAEELLNQAPETRVVLVGAERGIEKSILPNYPYPYYLIPAEPLYRRQWWRNFRAPIVAARVYRAGARIVETEQPDVVVGTGGYAAGPMVWLAARKGIPTAIQEQNAAPGLTTRLLAGSVDEVYLGAEEAMLNLRAGKQTTVLTTGNPIAPPDSSRQLDARRRFRVTGGLPVVVVTGGSQGSAAINKLIAAWLDSGGGNKVQLIWITGKATFAEFQRYHNPPLVQLFDFLDPMADAYAVADLVVGRAGMITIAELSAWGLPSILIPLPTAAQDHQTPNARAMQTAGAAVWLPQAGLSPSRLGAEIERIAADPVFRKKLSKCALSRGKPDAARVISARILKLANR